MPTARIYPQAIFCSFHTNGLLPSLGQLGFLLEGRVQECMGKWPAYDILVLCSSEQRTKPFVNMSIEYEHGKVFASVRVQITLTVQLS